MTNNNPNTPGAAPAPQQMPGGAPAALQMMVNAQYVKDLSFESPSAPQIFGAPAEADPKVEVSVNVSSQPLGENIYEVTLRLKTESRAAGKVAFICDLSYACIVTMPKLPDAQLRGALMVECPRLMFPFARAIIADAVRDGGFPPLMLIPIDFTEMLRQNELAQAKPAASA